MKATGIVRRVEECVQWGKPLETRINTIAFAGLPHPTHWCQNRVLGSFRKEQNIF